MLESKFQRVLINELNVRFPGIIITKTDPSYTRSFPDLILLYERNWAALETKRSEGSPTQPNQRYYVGLLNDMSFSRFVNPENIDEVLHDLEYALRP